MNFLEEIECPVCHKKFYLRCAPESYGWRLDQDLYCSYTCMRKIEKLLYPTEKSNLRRIPKDLDIVWQDMVELRSYSKKYDKLRRMKYSDKISQDGKEDLVKIIAECNKRMERLKIKYSYGIGKLTKENYQLIYGFAICGWNKDRLIKESGLSYDELCDKFETILRSLKRFVNTGVYRRRWICG